jgi:hypothetical protein
MAFLDFLRGPPAPVEYIHAVPVSARKLSATGIPSKENYVFYAFLFEQSADRALARLKKELRDEGFEFIEIAGQAESVPLAGWSDFVAKRLGWIKDALPTAAQLADAPRAQVHYSPKIVQL